MATAIGVVSISGGGVVLVGWHLDIAALKTIAAGFVTMKPNTALCFLLTGIALIMQTRFADALVENAKVRQRSNFTAILCAIIVSLVATATLLEYILDANFGIDALLTNHVLEEPIQFPGRMSQATALAFLLLSTAILGLDLETAHGARPAQYAALVCVLSGFTALLGYLFDVKALYQVNAYSTMALHTALLTTLLSAGILLCRPNKGLMAPITSRFVGGAMARSILPVTIAVLLVVGWLRLQGEHAGWYGTEFGLSLTIVSSILIFSFLVWLNARSLNKSDEARSRSEAATEKALHELHGTVEQLQASQELHRRAVESAGLGTWHLNLMTQELNCSNICLELFGFPHDVAVTRRQLIESIHVDDRALASEVRPRIEAGGSDFDIQYRAVWPDHSEHWLAVKGQGLYDHAGRATTIRGVVMDITARRKTETDRDRLKSQLRQAQKLNALGTLAAGIAHDFNNVLTAIVGNVRLAMEATPNDHPGRESIAEINKAAKRASDLVRRILAFGRAQDGNPVALQLQPIVGETIELLRASAPAMIEFRTIFARDIPNVVVDPTQIHQVVMNLVTNAAQAIGERSGLIEVAIDMVHVSSELAQTFAELREGNYVRLAVSDNGCGMDREIVERIFEPFYTTKAPSGGSGLGLSVAHGIVKHSGGTISVYSQPGKGTKFHVYLPASQLAAAIDSHAETDAALGHGERVLYVDDEEPLVLLMTQFLERNEYRVFGYTDAVQALAVFRVHPHDFDVVVTDLSMPHMSGFDLARELLRVRPDIPIIMTSGYVRREDAIIAHDLGIRELIAKPNTVDDLGRSLSRLFSTTTSNVT